MKIYWLNPPITSRELFTDIGWMNFRHYCQDYEWIMPIIDWEREINRKICDIEGVESIGDTKYIRECNNTHGLDQPNAE
jgi:hypothetical protein